MKEEEFRKLVAEIENCDVKTLKALSMEILATLAEKDQTVLHQKIHTAEMIDEKGIYEKYNYRTIESLSFYIRVIQKHFTPCVKCQEKLKSMLATGTWILGNKSYEPAIELNTTKNDIDDDWSKTIEKRKATKEELERIGLDGWKNLD